MHLLLIYNIIYFNSNSFAYYFVLHQIFGLDGRWQFFEWVIICILFWLLMHQLGKYVHLMSVSLVNVSLNHVADIITTTLLYIGSPNVNDRSIFCITRYLITWLIIEYFILDVPKIETYLVDQITVSFVSLNSHCF